MKIKLLWIGKEKDKTISSLIDKYVRRLKHYTKVEIVVINEVKASNRSEEQLKLLEAEIILSRVDRNSTLIALDETGDQLTSVGLSKFLQSQANASKRELIFLVGGAFGIHESVKSRADKVISLSKMTFTHDMARIVVTEQLYRAHTILKGEKYHHQ